MVSSVQTVVNQLPEGLGSLNVKNRRESFCFKGRRTCPICLHVLIASPCVKRKTYPDHRELSMQSNKTSQHTGLIYYNSAGRRMVQSPKSSKLNELLKDLHQAYVTLVQANRYSQIFTWGISDLPELSTAACLSSWAGQDKSPLQREVEKE